MKFFGSSISLGQIVALALTGLAAYHEVETSPAGAALFLDPERTAPYLSEVLSILAPKPEPAQAELPLVVNANQLSTSGFAPVTSNAQQNDSLGIVRGAGGSV